MRTTRGTVGACPSASTNDALPAGSRSCSRRVNSATVPRRVRGGDSWTGAPETTIPTGSPAESATAARPTRICTASRHFSSAGSGNAIDPDASITNIVPTVARSLVMRR